ncbi:ribosomal protein L32 [Rhizoctonia solani AG-3 Rhs1AP]|uniref:Large ribosomal subunit protein bL32m n=2 Tax=Rhizoctonia solani AG-3 TaxID=1086053 RepID=A0A074S6C3_9AGAM|nr:ribosomal protein L32 [Rhizoctonia solani AG-3 Rhs1AP]KEP53165.1 ribosomal protein L32 [Rhizoctonia solani 123E]
MASLALSLTRTFTRSTWASFSGLTVNVPAPSGSALRLAERLSALPSLRTLLELFPPIVLAVPKKKTSPSRKRMRSANKGLKDKTNIVNCPGCGAPKRSHHVCPQCFSEINRAWKASQREVGPGISM